MRKCSARCCAATRLLFCTLTAGLLLAASSAHAATIYALTDENDLLVFDSANPEDLLYAGAILFLQNDEDLIGIDIRPSNGQLYGVGNKGGVYALSNTAFLPASPITASKVSQLSEDLSGSRFGVDFNPVADRLRIVSDTEQNLRVNVDTGATVVDSLLQYGPGQPGATGDNPSVVGSAYTNSLLGAGGTSLYGIDVRSSEDRLVIQNPPNSGTLTVVGPLGVNASALQGFDILSTGNPVTNTGFAAMQITTGGVSQLYSINLATGAASLLGDIGGGDLIDGLAVVSDVVPEPSTIAMAAFALVGGVLARRRGR